MYQFPIDSFTLTTSEVPSEVSLVIVFNNCQQRCPNCHSPHLWVQRKLYFLNDVVMKVRSYIAQYPEVTNILLMGGTTNGLTQKELDDLIRVLGDILPIAIYSGSNTDDLEHYRHMDSVLYFKTGSYQEVRGGLETQGTNQRFYRKEYDILFDNSCVYIGRVPVWVDVTRQFYQKKRG